MMVAMAEARLNCLLMVDVFMVSTQLPGPRHKKWPVF